MMNILLSQNLRLLKGILGKKIVSVKRQLFKNDLDVDDFEQNADGPIQLVFDDGQMIYFIAETEIFSVGLNEGVMPRYGDSYVQVDVSSNLFWRKRVRQKIMELTIFKGSDWTKDYPSEFGLEIIFKNGEKVIIEYRDEEKYPDMIMVSSCYTGGTCIIESIK